jgi:hypothetical protein
MDHMKQLTNVDKQIKQWSAQLLEVRSAFAVGLQLGQAYDDFDRIIEEMKQFRTLVVI